MKQILGFGAFKKSKRMVPVKKRKILFTLEKIQLNGQLVVAIKVKKGNKLVETQKVRLEIGSSVEVKV